MPDLQTLEDITQQPIPNETVLNYELWALKKMGWKLNARTPLAFVVTHPFEHHPPFSLTHPLPLPLNPHILPPPPSLSPPLPLPPPLKASYIVAGVTAPHDTCWDVVHGCPYTLDGLATRIRYTLFTHCIPYTF